MVNIMAIITINILMLELVHVSYVNNIYAFVEKVVVIHRGE